MLSHNWPPDFPDNCPPASARPAAGVFYRIVKTNPPQPDDFVSQYHQNRRLANSNIQRGRATQCETMGLSIYADINDAIRAARRYPRLGDKIATLTLLPASGKVIPTPRNGNTHHTWWVVADYRPAATVAITITFDP